MRIKISRLDKTAGHEWMQEPPSGWKRNTTGRVEDHIPRAKVRESLVETDGARPTRGRVLADQ